LPVGGLHHLVQGLGADVGRDGRFVPKREELLAGAENRLEGEHRRLSSASGRAAIRRIMTARAGARYCRGATFTLVAAAAPLLSSRGALGRNLWTTTPAPTPAAP